MLPQAILLSGSLAPPGRRMGDDDRATQGAREGAPLHGGLPAGDRRMDVGAPAREHGIRVGGEFARFGTDEPHERRLLVARATPDARAGHNHVVQLSHLRPARSAIRRAEAPGTHRGGTGGTHRPASARVLTESRPSRRTARVRRTPSRRCLGTRGTTGRSCEPRASSGRIQRSEPQAPCPQRRGHTRLAHSVVGGPSLAADDARRGRALRDVRHTARASRGLREVTRSRNRARSRVRCRDGCRSSSRSAGRRAERSAPRVRWPATTGSRGRSRWPLWPCGR